VFLSKLGPKVIESLLKRDEVLFKSLEGVKLLKFFREVLGLNQFC
jgi:hypothetical protein